MPEYEHKRDTYGRFVVRKGKGFKPRRQRQSSTIEAIKQGHSELANSIVGEVPAKPTLTIFPGSSVVEFEDKDGITEIVSFRPPKPRYSDECDSH
jgi:hypothetical protein